MEHSIAGQCLCGKARWQIQAEPSPLAHCHCSICRKMHGTAFATYMASASGTLRWLAGEASVRHMETSPGFVRAFCSQCGSVVPGVASDGHIFSPAGCLHDDARLSAKIHIFVGSKAPWFDINDGLRQFEAFPKAPGRVVSAARANEDSLLSGSCQCNAIAFQVTAPIERVHNCHCSRCRKARASAYASNGFVKAGGLHFLRGESALVLFKLPNARTFAQAFCGDCGSPMPRIDRGRDIAVIPYGSLDTAPAVRPQEHIFVDFKAPWYNIVDELPRYPAHRV